MIDVAPGEILISEDELADLDDPYAVAFIIAAKLQTRGVMVTFLPRGEPL